jgi:uncharacterized protein YgbK (DUF1537 family)
VTTLRLLADDLTGALDTAAQFVGLTGPIPVLWTTGAHGCDSAAFDSGTRELPAAAAQARVAAMADVLAPQPGRIAFKKVDSLLRGHSGAELAACLRIVSPRRCIVAPAFPFQGRVTRAGRQYMSIGDAWRPVGEDLRETLAEAGVSVTAARPGDAVPEGVSLWDAENDADLAAIARAGLAADGSLLWCGSSGLAGALAGVGHPVPRSLARPVLGLFGSDHPVTAAQLLAAETHLVRLEDGGPVGAARLTEQLDAAGAALVAFDLPSGIGRSDAAAAITRELGALAGRIPAPRTLLVAGGETLRALCLLLGADRLDVQGQMLPGIPQSILRGGRWDGVTVVSKSGAFGEEGLLRQLLAAAPHHEELDR